MKAKKGYRSASRNFSRYKKKREKVRSQYDQSFIHQNQDFLILIYLFYCILLFKTFNLEYYFILIFIENFSKKILS